MKLKDKVALVTGAALGYKEGGPSIGSAIAFKFASEGAKVVVVDILEEMGQRTADAIVEKVVQDLFAILGVVRKDSMTPAEEVAEFLKVYAEMTGKPQPV